MNEDQVKAIMPNLSQAKLDIYFPFLTAAMDEFEVNTPTRQAMFLAQVAHESGEFRYMEEIWGPTPAQKLYEPPSRKASELGNTETGDGKLFKGHGPIQITGRANHQKYGDLLSVDLISNPSLAATPEVGFRLAGCYWKQNGLNELADENRFTSITVRINGGTNGLSDRLMYLARAKAALV